MEINKLLRLYVAAVLLIHSALAFKHYQYLIPNGDRVNHPCFPNKLWWGVGHFSQAGGGARNAFGRDFAANGHKWTEALCRKDSDGDGRTNGEELGDPHCVWRKDAVAERTFNVTHPGVCEPITSDKCKKLNGDWNLCVSDTFKCPAIKEPGVTNITLQYKRTLVPAKVTNYFCQAFELPSDDDYHMVANQPVIDNANFMHHILVFGCDSKPDEALFKAPRPCGMGGSKCKSIIGLWALGYLGECFPKEYGMLIGKNGYKYVVLQYHWNNPAMLSGQYDASAMIIYLSKNLRPNNGGVFMAGQRYLKIPPGKESVVQTSVCSSNCTNNKLHQKIYFTDILAHMHYAGRRAEVSQYRNGTLLRKILPLSEIRYDEPQKFRLKQGVDVLPGDELVTKCDYRSVGNSDTIYYGDSTQDEMCFIFVNFYPSQPFSRCIDYGEVDMCTLNSVENGGDGNRKPGRIGDCNLGDFLYEKLPKYWMPRISEFCDFSIDACRETCMQVMKEMNETEPCWKGWPRKYIEFISIFGKSFDNMKRLRLSTAACERHMAVLAVQSPPKPGVDKETGGSKVVDVNYMVLIVVGCVAVAALLAVVTIIGLIRAFKQQPVHVEVKPQIGDHVAVQQDTRRSSFHNRAYTPDEERTAM